MALFLKPEHDEFIRKQAEAAYPDECCGALIGTVHAGISQSLFVKALANVHEDGHANRFRIDPTELMIVERSAQAFGVSVIGYYHSHPDTAPVPSEYDREHAWEGYSYAIVQVDGGTSQLMRSWVLDDATRSFLEEEIVVSDL